MSKAEKTVVEFMEESPIHAMFAVQALENFSKKVVQNQQEIRKQLGKSSIISAEAWIGAADSWEAKLTTL